MTRKQALTDLLAKVEAGNFLAVDLSNVLIINIHHAVGLKNGSLDAAKALHEAVLPECGRAVDATMPEAGICVDIHREARVLGAGDNLCEARAWLIAIIKALIAEETQ